MASSIPSILLRKVKVGCSSHCIVGAVGCGGIISSLLLDADDDTSKRLFGDLLPSLPPTTTASCEAQPVRKDKPNPFLTPQPREALIRRKMTSIGRFSLKSETDTNRSIPTFFLALAGEKKQPQPQVDPTTSMDTMSSFNSNNRKIFTVEDFEEQWLKQGMPSRHPRFHSTVCDEQKYFEETHHHINDGEEQDDDEPSLQIKAELDRHAFETMHYSVYREDLRNRIEHMLVSPIEVSDKLWEVKISNGVLGSSGAISKAKVDAITKHKHPLRRKMTKGGLWRDATQEIEDVPMESVLLFRSHHALADGASIMGALSDLCDEAEDIRADIEMQLTKWKRGGAKKRKNLLQRILRRLTRLMKICVWLSFGTLRAMIYQLYLQATTRHNPFDAVREDAKKKGLALSGRSISWCDAAPLTEVKRIAEVIGKARGITVTVNDLFVSCVTAAVTRQLIEHEEFMAPIDAHQRKYASKTLNVVVPVHLRGGVILPGEGMGNRIGAFVTRVPGEMKHDASGGGACPIERLEQVHNSLLSCKKSPAPLVSHYLAKFCSSFLPENWTASVFCRANANASVAISNNRGYNKKLHINGMMVQSAAGFLPLPPGIPIGVVVQSYAGQMSLSVTAEKYAVPDADKFLRWTLDEYQRLSDEACKLEKKNTIVE